MRGCPGQLDIPIIAWNIKDQQTKYFVVKFFEKELSFGKTELDTLVMITD